MRIDHDRYLDQVLGGWIGKSIGGVIGARFETLKTWIELAPADFFPPTLPPNDDLDLQVVWLSVLEERGLATTSQDLAEAWLERCWYPFSEYGVFRRNWRCGIHAPTSGVFANPFWAESMGCPIRAEIWGYVFPGDPERAAHYAGLDGSLDHGPESVGAEQMFAAMAAEAFDQPDLRLLVERHRRRLPQDSAIARQTALALEGLDRGDDLRLIRDRLIFNAPASESCSARINVPFTVLGLLAGKGDPVATIRTTLAFGYDTDCTLATAIAFLGQVAGAKALPDSLTNPIGDRLVMGIGLTRPDMTLTALARDTVRLGCLFAGETGACTVVGAPTFAPLPRTAAAPGWRLTVEHVDRPGAAPGDTLRVRIAAVGVMDGPQLLTIAAPTGWEVSPQQVQLEPGTPSVMVHCHCRRDIPQVPTANRFVATCGDRQVGFGFKGAELWRLLGIDLALEPTSALPAHGGFRRVTDTFADPSETPLPPAIDGDERFRHWSEVIGRPALVPCRELVLTERDLSPVPSTWHATIERVFVCPTDRVVELQIGHDCPLRAWCNGALLGEERGPVQWQPLSSCWSTRLRAGENRIRIQLTKAAGTLRFSLEVKEVRGPQDWDYATDLMDVNPLVGRIPADERRCIGIGSLSGTGW